MTPPPSLPSTPVRITCSNDETDDAASRPPIIIRAYGEHHGAAAAVSIRQGCTWIPAAPSSSMSVASSSSSPGTSASTRNRLQTDRLVYASHAILNVAEPQIIPLGTISSSSSSSSSSTPSDALPVNSNAHNNNKAATETLTSTETVWTVCQTLRTNLLEQQQLLQPESASSETSSLPVITALGSVADPDRKGRWGLICGYSNGAISIWLPDVQKQDHHHRHHREHWEELIIPISSHNRLSITTITAIWEPMHYRAAQTQSDMNHYRPGDVGIFLAVGTAERCLVYQIQIHQFVGSATTTPYTDQKEQQSLTTGQQSQSSLQQEHQKENDFKSTMQVIAISPIHETAVCTVQWHYFSSTKNLCLLVGTAAPRHNKIHIHQIRNQGQKPRDNFHNYEKEHGLRAPRLIHYVGALVGHEDWITCFDWWEPLLERLDDDDAVVDRQRTVDIVSSTRTNAAATSPTSVSSSTCHPLLASGSQDCKIRLWMFRSHQTKTMVGKMTTSNADSTLNDAEECTDVTHSTNIDKDHSDGENSVHDHHDADEDDEEGESRLEMITQVTDSDHTIITSITLEALLIGHEESVTSVIWHPNPQDLYGHDQLLISSSLDRSILLWGSSDEGIWVPLTRVGSAGGILGGAVGSSLLGYCQVTVDPRSGRHMIGHAYGGSLHIWSAHESLSEQITPTLSLEERASFVRWKASPCITGHFHGVTDLCWEACKGEYLLTVGNDQTCRLWAPVQLISGDNVWLELARPQVHGYTLSAVGSLSTRKHRHLFVSGADEKEIRVFDAPRATLRLLQAISRNSTPLEDSIDRVERAFIPALGLSNKANIADRAEEVGDAEEASADAKLPVERDLGAASLWPEVRKLFGHNTELYCFAVYTNKDENKDDVLLASSCKARTVQDASIRLWNVSTGAVQVLEGGHKSTVATLDFSSDGNWLASSGKDRRLCLWKREISEYNLAWVKDSAHKRIIWSVSFCPNDSSMLASGSRDGCIKIWHVDAVVSVVYSFPPQSLINTKPTSVTSIAFAPIMIQNRYAMLAVGLESGRIELFLIPTWGLGEKPSLLMVLPLELCHVASITKLAWRPLEKCTKHLFLASSSMDCGCRINRIEIPSLDADTPHAIEM